MDPLTHAAAGAVAMLACPRRPLTPWALPLAALSAASPDIDIFFVSSPLDFLLLHRGITHSLAAVPLLGLILAVLSWPLWRSDTKRCWTFGTTWLFSCLMLLLHIWLDIITTYGTMVFLPFSHERIRLNAVFIVDLLLTLPLLWAVWRWRARRGLLLLTLVWVFIYPAAAIGLNQWHTVQNVSRLESQGRQPQTVTILPDAFAPLYWRLLYEETTPQGHIICEQSLDALGRPRDTETIYPAVPPQRIARLTEQSTVCKAFFDFSLLPVESSLPATDLPHEPRTQADGLEGFRLYYDLRFGSGLGPIRRLMELRPNAAIPFQLMVETVDQNLLLERMRFSDSGKDSGWQVPRRPLPPSWEHWLVGLY